MFNTGKFKQMNLKFLEDNDKNLEYDVFQQIEMHNEMVAKEFKFILPNGVPK